MLIILIRALILFFVLLVVMRLMGKRQIGEMEPFEFVITLIIAELACIPMADRSIPITYGIVAIATIFIIHQLIILLLRSSKMQEVISGKPVMVIDKHGINEYALNRMNMQVNDLLQSVRSAGYFSIEEIDYGLMETNGQLSVVPNNKLKDKEQTLPVPLILSGKWEEQDMARYSVKKKDVEEILQTKKVKVKNVLLFTVDEKGRVFLQPHGKPYYAFDSGKKVLTKPQKEESK